MRINIRQMLMLMVLFGLISALVVAIAQRPVRDRPNHLVVSPNGQKVATFSQSGNAVVYDMSDDTAVRKSRQLVESVPFGFSRFMQQNNVAFADDETLVVSSFRRFGGKSQTTIWDLHNNETKDLSKSSRPGTDFVSVTSKYLVREDPASNQMLLENIIDSNEPNTILPINCTKINFSRNVDPVCFSNDTSRVLVVQDVSLQANSSELILYDVKNKKKIASHQIQSGNLIYDYSVSISKDNSIIALRDGNYGLTIFDGQLNRISGPTTMGSFGDRFDQIALSPDGQLLAYSVRYGENSNNIRIINTKDQSEVANLKITRSWFNFRFEREFQFEFSDDGKKLFVTTGSSDSGLEVWDVASATRLRRVGVVNRFGPGFLYGIGFCIWAGVWGLMMRAKLKRAILDEKTNEANIEFDAEKITDDDIIEDSVVDAALAEPAEQTAGLPPQMQPPKPQRPPVTTIGFDHDMNPETPGGIKATWVMMIIGGIWGIFYACVSGFYITVSGMFTLEILMFAFRIAATAFVLLTGIMALSRGIGRYTSKLYLTAGLQMVTVMMCDFVNFTLGIAGLICTSVGQSGYFISGRGARIGYFKKRKPK